MSDMPSDTEDLLGEEKPRRRWPWQWRWRRGSTQAGLPGRPRRRYWRIGLIALVVLLLV